MEQFDWRILLSLIFKMLYIVYTFSMAITNLMLLKSAKDLNYTLGQCKAYARTLELKND